MKWNNIFQGLTEKNCQLRILYLVKAFRNEREIETLLNKGKLGLSLADRPAKRMAKGSHLRISGRKKERTVERVKIWGTGEKREWMTIAQSAKQKCARRSVDTRMITLNASPLLFYTLFIKHAVSSYCIRTQYFKRSHPKILLHTYLGEDWC